MMLQSVCSHLKFNEIIVKFIVRFFLTIYRSIWKMNFTIT
jgi:hypothetical protein